MTKSTEPTLEVSTPQMNVRKRNGSLEPVDLNKIQMAIDRAAEGIEGMTRAQTARVAIKTIGGLYDGASTQDLDMLSIQTAAAFISEDPYHSKLAANLLSEYIRKEAVSQNIESFSQSIKMGYDNGLINEKLYTFVTTNSRKLNNAVNDQHNRLFEYFGLRTVYDRYLLRHPITRKVIETPQYFFMRVAAALSDTVQEAIDLYRIISRMQYMPSTPTLFNAGTVHEQMSSCYLMAPPHDSLDGIYQLYADIARNSKYAGGIGAPLGTIRSEGSLIKGTNGKSNGIIPWIATLNMSVAAVNQGGKRKGAAAIYLPCWHADIEAFLELRDNTGDHARRAYNLNLAQWIPDLFMEAVEKGGEWHLFDPAVASELNDLFGDEFRSKYAELVDEGKAAKVVNARDLYGRMMKTLAETGNGWMCWSDASNMKANQTKVPGNVVHSSNLCTEIIEVTKRSPYPEEDQTAVCNLGSLVLPSYVKSGKFDFDAMTKVVKRVIRQLDNVIDRNFYPINSAHTSNHKWRPVGLGVMGLQDVFFLLGYPFDSSQALALSTKIAEEIYYAALSASCDLAQERGTFPAFKDSRTADGVLQFDMWNVTPSDPERWDALRERIKTFGLRNSLLIAIAPTATIGSITGVYECIEPQVSNLLKRETLSGEFIQINKYLVRDLKAIDLWNEDTRMRIKLAEGSIQGIEAIPENLRLLYRTAWELSNKSLIDLAAARGPYIDQSQSLNLFMESPNIGKLSSMYIYAWKSGLKTTYYLRSRPATKIAKTTVSAVNTTAAVACSLDNPETCESCQ